LVPCPNPRVSAKRPIVHFGDEGANTLKKAFEKQSDYSGKALVVLVTNIVTHSKTRGSVWGEVMEMTLVWTTVSTPSG
jgi:hypothetical protein